jgi:hypothetical protein
MNLRAFTLLPTWVSALILVCAIAIPTTMWHAFRRTGSDAKIDGSRRVSIGLAVILFFWITAAISLSLQGFFEANSSVLVLNIAYSLLPVLAGVGLWFASRSFRETVRAVPADCLIRIQSYRALGLVYLVSWYCGLLPGVFAIPAGVGDLLVGISAPVVASVVRRRSSLAGLAATLWNVFGLIDLVTGVTFGFLTSPSPLEQLARERPNIMITTFPMVLLPAIIVPLSILCHFYSIRVGTAINIPNDRLRA